MLSWQMEGECSVLVEPRICFSLGVFQIYQLNIIQIMNVYECSNGKNIFMR
jgi:hypothetical protein